MSRIGKLPITIPENVDINCNEYPRYYPRVLQEWKEKDKEFYITVY